MDETVECVARALAEFDWLHVGGADGDNQVPGTPNWKFKVPQAKAVLKALAERGPVQVRTIYEAYGFAPPARGDG